MVFLEIILYPLNTIVILPVVQVLFPFVVIKNIGESLLCQALSKFNLPYLLTLFKCHIVVLRNFADIFLSDRFCQSIYDFGSIFTNLLKEWIAENAIDQY